MRTEHLQVHLDRRRLLARMAQAGAAGALLAAGGGSLVARTAGAAPTAAQGPSMLTPAGGPFDDSFDHREALNGTWANEATGRYGYGDELGTLNEVTPERTARALGLLAGATAVRTIRLGHLLRNGMPAPAAFPPRVHEQRLSVTGYTPDRIEQFFSTDARGRDGEDRWRAADRAQGPLGYLDAEPLGANLLSSHEERFPEGGTLHIGTRLDNLNHIGVGPVFYNGFRGNHIANAVGTTNLGSEKMPPFVTRGVLLDVLGWKQATGAAGVQRINGNPMLGNRYRITVEDLQATMAWEGVDSIEAGDAVVIRTGWWTLAEDPETYGRYLATEPGIYLREAKFLAEHRPALIAADTWALEVVGLANAPWAFPVHQTLLTRWGIRIGEGVIADDLAAARIYRFVYVFSPPWTQGATAANGPPVALVPQH